MWRAPRSHYLPLCSPSSGRARQRRSVLTIPANERRRPTHTGDEAEPGLVSETVTLRWGALPTRSCSSSSRASASGDTSIRTARSPDPHPAPLFSELIVCLAFRDAAIENSCENEKGAKRRGFANRAGNGQKPWLSRTASRRPHRRVPLAGIVSTFLRWRAERDDGEHSGR